MVMREVRSSSTSQTARSTDREVLAVWILSARSVHRLGLMTTEAPLPTNPFHPHASSSARTVGTGLSRFARRRKTETVTKVTSGSSGSGLMHHRAGRHRCLQAILDDFQHPAQAGV